MASGDRAEGSGDLWLVQLLAVRDMDLLVCTVYIHCAHAEIQVADGQKLYQPEVARTLGTITRSHIRDIFEELPEALGMWKDRRKTAWLLRIVPPTAADEHREWKACTPCIHDILYVAISHIRSTPALVISDSVWAVFATVCMMAEQLCDTIYRLNRHVSDM